MVKSTSKFPFSDEFPQFFKIYVPRQCSHQLRIPPAFVKELNGDLRNNFVITSPSKGSWRVDLNKVDHNLYFQKGWHEFVLSNGLQHGDFLIFCYDGNSEFYVKIFGKDGCQKVPNSNEKTQKTLAVVQENQTFEQRKCKQMRFGDSGNGVNKMTSRPRVPLAIEEPQRDNKEASNFVSAHPFFKVVITPAYANNGFLHIPSSFYRSYVDKDIKSVFLRVSDKLWPVKVVGSNIGRLSEGWRSFAQEYTLQVGDVCVFELIERKEFVLKVAIFRCHVE